MPLVSGPMLLAQTMGASVAFLNARRKVRPHASANDTPGSCDRPAAGSPGGLVAQLGPFLIVCGAAAYVGLPLGSTWKMSPHGFQRTGTLLDSRVAARSRFG